MEHKNPFYLFKLINDRFETRGNNDCQKAGITFSQFRILLHLFFNQDRIITQRELEKEFKVSHPTISGIIKRMEERGVISTKIIQESKKQKQIFLTEKGFEALETMKKSKDRDDKMMEKLFTEAELNTLEEYLLRIIDYLSK